MTEHAEFGLLIDRMHRKLDAEMRQLVPGIDIDCLGSMGSMTLMALSQIEPAPIGQLVIYLSRHKSQVTRTVRMLEEKGMIERSGQEGDRRMQIVHLTTKGGEFVKKQEQLMARAVAEMLEPLSAEERVLLQKALRKIDASSQSS